MKIKKEMNRLNINQLNKTILKMKKRVKKADKESEAERLAIDWSKKDWKKVVVNHYNKVYDGWKQDEKKLQKIQGHSYRLSFLNRNLKIKIVGLIEREKYRVYTIVTPWMIDTIMELMVTITTEIDKDQKGTQIDALTNEKSRWIFGGTSLTEKHTNSTAKEVGEKWAEDAAYDIERIFLSDLHKMG